MPDIQTRKLVRPSAFPLERAIA